MGGTQVLACVDASLLAAEPLAVHEVGAGDVDGDAAAPEALDRFLVELVGFRAVAEQRARSRFDPERPVRAAGARPLGQTLEGDRSDVAVVGASGGFDELDHRPARRDRCRRAHTPRPAASNAAW